MSRILAANWKMNLGLAQARSLYGAVSEGRAASPGVTMLVFPPFTVLAALAASRGDRGPALGGQNCHAEARGAFTGEIAAEQLRDAGAEYVLVGHSERRRLFCEGDLVARQKLTAAWRAGLKPVLCVGETLAERERGETRDVVARQIGRALEGSGPRTALLVAYEPVWAIGTGVVATSDQIGEAHRWVREELGAGRRGEQSGPVPILYGGSVNSKNAVALAAIPEVDGFLVGGASLEVAGFLSIAAALETTGVARAG